MPVVLRMMLLMIPLAVGCGGEDDEKGDSGYTSMLPDDESEGEGGVERIEGTEPGDCTDDADNDGDGLFDCDDDGCTGSPDCDTDTEAPPDTPDTPDSVHDTRELWTLEAIDLYPFDGDNHLLPVEFLVLPQARRGYSYSLALGTFAEVDLDSAELLRVFPGTGTATSVTLFGGGQDLLYIARRGKPALQSLDLLTGEILEVRAGLPEVNALLLLSADRLAMVGVTKDGSNILQIVDPTQDYLQLSFVGLNDIPRAILNINNTELAVVLGKSGTEGSVEIRDRQTLALVRSCPAPFGASAAAFTPQGDVVLAVNDQIGLAPCAPPEEESEAEPREPILMELGSENMEVIPLPTGVLVLDRIGESDPNWSIARHFDTSAGTLELDDSFTTGKNSGRGGRDPNTGKVWMNSEGTTEVWSMEPSTGLPLQKVPLGMHIESLAEDTERGQVFVTGRLSGVVLSVDFLSAQMSSADIGFDWPVAPVVAQEQLWVLDQLAGVLHAFDTADLRHRLELDLGWGVSDSLTISDSLYHPVSQTLFLSSGALDQVIEVDPVSQEVLRTFSLDAPLAPDNPGKLELLAFGDQVLVARSYDGRLSVLGTDGSVRHHEPLSGVLEARSHMQFSVLSLDDSLLYVGPHAVNTSDWSRAEELDRDWSFALSSDSDGTWLAWRWPDSALLRIDADGAELEVLSTGLALDANPEWLITPWSERLISTDMTTGELRVFTSP